MSDIYSSIPNDMYAAAKAMGHQFLREGSKEELERIKDKLPLIQYQRALHFYNENERVGAALLALEHKDMDLFLNCVNGSENSSRNLLHNAMINEEYEGSLAQAIDRSNEAMEHKGATKINGGGFAGTIIAIVPDKYFENYKKVMSDFYGPNHVFPVNPLK